MQYSPRLIHVEAVRTAVIRGHMTSRDFAQFVPAACGEVWSFIRAAKLPQQGRHVALYLDAHGTIEAGAELAGPFSGTDRVHCSQLPGGTVVTAIHFGPYGGLGEAHAAVREWCARHGQKQSDICWEIYGHWEESWNADPSKIRTDVFHLLVE